MKNIYKALSDFQQEVPTIKKNASGYNYKFADLEEIIAIIKPVLKKHNLGYTQPLDGTNLRTVLYHTESGETIESTVEIPQGVELKGQNDFQVLGSAITYLRRYSLSSILGLVTDEDADAAGEQTNTPKASENKPASEKQLRLIRTLAGKQGLTGDLLEQRIAQIKTSADASKAIEKLQS